MKELCNSSMLFRLTNEEKELIKKKAIDLGYTSVSKYIRTVALNQREIKPKADVELMLQIKKIGVNINQIAAICNHYKSDQVIKEIYSSLKEEIKNLDNLVSKL